MSSTHDSRAFFSCHSRFTEIFNFLHIFSVVNCIPCASYISFKRVSQIPINCSFNEGFFHINQAKNFFSHVLKSVFIEGVNETQKHCGVAIVLVLNVFFFVEEVFVGAFCLVMMTVMTGTTATSNWGVVGGGKVFSQVSYTFC